MIEKRFRQSRHWCTDRVKKRKTKYWEDAVDWLNELNEEYNKLKIICNAKEKTIKNLLEMGIELEKENVELKAEIQQLKNQK